MNDKELINMYLEGNIGAFDLLIDRYLVITHRNISRYIGDQNVIDDIVQQTFIKVWKKLPDFDTTQSFRSWLSVIARNTAIDYLRTQQKFLKLAEGWEHKLEDTNIESRYEQFSSPHFSFALVGTLLPKKYFAVVDLYYGKGYSLREISIVLHRPLETIRSQHKRAIALLADVFNKNE